MKKLTTVVLTALIFFASGFSPRCSELVRGAMLSMEETECINSFETASVGQCLDVIKASAENAVEIHNAKQIIAYEDGKTNLVKLSLDGNSKFYKGTNYFYKKDAASKLNIKGYFFKERR